MTSEELAAVLQSAEAAQDYVQMVAVLEHAADHGIWEVAATWRKVAKLLHDDLGDLHGARDAWRKVLDAASGDAEAETRLNEIERAMEDA